MRILITGGTGFIGEALTRYCVEAGCSVLALDIRESEVPAGAEFERCDVRDAPRLTGIIGTFRPQRVFHLAAQSSVVESITRPQDTVDVNVGGTISLFEALHGCGLNPMVVVACSSAQYGQIGIGEAPVREDWPLNPFHPYGVSKVAQDLLAAQYCTRYSIPAIRMRIFGTTGPGKIGDVCSDLTRRAVEIEFGLTRKLIVGNLQTRRTILDVRDLVRALWLSAGCCAPGEAYNVGGSRAYSIEELVGEVRAQTQVGFEVDQRPELMRAHDEPVIAGDNSKLRQACGWEPQIRLQVTLGEMLAWWRIRMVTAKSGRPAKLRSTNA